MVKRSDILQRCRDLGIDPERATKALFALSPTGDWSEGGQALMDRLIRTGTPEPPTPPRCANCRQPYDSPHPDCLAVVHQRQRVEPGWVPTHRTAGFQPRPQPELWPCKECGELPMGQCSWTGIADCYQYNCSPCHDGIDEPFVEASTEPQARAAWNERFGRAPERCLDCCANLVELGTLYCESCQDEDDIRASNAVESLNRRAPGTGCVCGRQPKDGNCARCANPHNLIPCECGEIPRPVAYLEKRKWWWGVECHAGIQGGHFMPDGVRNWLQEGGSRIEPERHIQARRYDIPTHVTLGCAELPKEYREPK
jgi:hypothetical protein